MPSKEGQPQRTLLALAPFSQKESEESTVEPRLSQDSLKGVNTVPDEMAKHLLPEKLMNRSLKRNNDKEFDVYKIPSTLPR
ncbi:MAG: hypothetical protein L0Y56_09490 [Nitrospira sp.]|nr:hypothetical protein [Nitrospira sp.]